MVVVVEVCVVLFLAVRRHRRGHRLGRERMGNASSSVVVVAWLLDDSGTWGFRYLVMITVKRVEWVDLEDKQKVRKEPKQ